MTITVQPYHNLPTTLAVIPLKGTVLLPRSVLPLNIFERQFVALIDDIMAQNRMVALVQPKYMSHKKRGASSHEQELAHIGCAGRLTSFQEVDPDRYLIGLTGVCRFQVKQDVPTDKPYPILEVDYTPFLSDLQKGFGEKDVNRDEVISTFRTYLEVNQLETDWQVIDEASNEFLVNTLCVMSPFGAAEKQAFLEAPDLKTRAQTLVAVTEMDIATQNRHHSIIH